MKKHLLSALVAIIALGASAHAAEVKSYQVTGPVTDVTPTAITVQKGQDKWQIATGKASLPADVKVGSKVTIQYTMTATDIELKDAKTKK